jgi:Fe-S-cluster containining protein
VSQGRLDTLNQIYALYNDFSKGLSMACRRGCSMCCTQNVTMTTLEGCGIIEYLRCNDEEALLSLAHATPRSEWYRPMITTNDFALFCLKGDDPPEEQNDYSGFACRFLSNNECVIYDARPFGCRCFFSTQACETEACAVIDPFLLTVNTVFLQFIEHIDTGGFFGNLNDILALLASGDRNNLANNSLHLSTLPRNRSIPGLLISPEHQERMEPILRDLRRIAFQQGSTAGKN